jgi:hypothetical protein
MVDKNNNLLIRNVEQETHALFAGWAKSKGLGQGDALKKLVELAEKK